MSAIPADPSTLIHLHCQRESDSLRRERDAALRELAESTRWVEALREELRSLNLPSEAVLASDYGNGGCVTIASSVEQIRRIRATLAGAMP